jgi:hypothetical protein
MNKIEWFWNLVYYILYKLEKKTTYIINIPIILILKTPIIDRFYKKRGYSDITNHIFNTLNNKKYGLNSTLAGIYMGGLASCFVGIFYYNFIFFLPIPMAEFIRGPYVIITILILFIPPVKFNNLALYNDDKYLKYFKEFDTYDKKRLIKWSIIAFIFVTLTIFLSFGSLIYLLTLDIKSSI